MRLGGPCKGLCAANMLYNMFLIGLWPSVPTVVIETPQSRGHKEMLSILAD
jgi:hypothetical protein